MIHVNTLTNAYEILEGMFEVIRIRDSHHFIENDGPILEFTVIDDGGNNGVWSANWVLADSGYVGYELTYT